MAIKFRTNAERRLSKEIIDSAIERCENLAGFDDPGILIETLNEGFDG